MQNKSKAIDWMSEFANDGLRTYEDVAELYAAEGWGCKMCGQLTSPEWWCCGGDIFCTRCKKALWRELREPSTRFPTRTETGLARTVTRAYNPDSQGFEVAAWQRKEYERLYS